VVLKLHGSIDWGRATDRKFLAQKNWEYVRLDEVIHGIAKRPARRDESEKLGESEKLVRFRTFDHPTAKLRARLGFDEPLMATMAAGKDTFISDLQDIWDDAYWALSRADRLDIVGYSFPPDDLELRTLLRVTTRQPGQAAMSDGVEVYVCNPSPNTHERARRFLGTGLYSSYEGAGAWALRRRRTAARPQS
jgi:hypothetical protein